MFLTTDDLDKGGAMSKIHVLMSEISGKKSSISYATSDADSLIANVDYLESDKVALMLKMHVIMSEIADQMLHPLNFTSNRSVSTTGIPDLIPGYPDLKPNSPDLRSIPNNLITRRFDLSPNLPLMQQSFFFGFNFIRKKKSAKYLKLKQYINLFR
jgi:hypothetical protein